MAFDFGAGSLEVAAVRIEAGKTLETGRTQVLAKQSLRIGGDDVDQWIVKEFVPEPLKGIAKLTRFYSNGERRGLKSQRVAVKLQCSHSDSMSSEHLTIKNSLTCLLSEACIAKSTMSWKGY